MTTLFDSASRQATLARIEQLRPDSPRQWGKMDVAQMLAHCSAALEVATGDQKPPRLLLGRLMGWMVRASYVSDRPFSRNNPTAPSFVIADARDFEREKQRLAALIRRFGEGGPARATTHPHSFFGQLSPDEWGKTQAKHLDHHLRQFGV